MPTFQPAFAESKTPTGTAQYHKFIGIFPHLSATDRFSLNKDRLGKPLRYRIWTTSSRTGTLNRVAARSLAI